MFGSSMVAQSANVSASATYKRSKITKVKAENFYSIGSKGNTYVFKGSAKHLVLKRNHKLTNYKKTTWVCTAKTVLTRNGKMYRYYYVTNAKNKAKGWVWNVHLQAGKNYQSSKVTNFKGTYQRKKAGKLYKVTGSKKYIKLSHGSKLANNVKYTASKKRTIYKKRKAYKYYYVTNKTTKQKGWVWSGYLTKSKKATPAKKSSNQGNTTNGVPGMSNNSGADFTIAKTVSQSVTLLNSERTKLGRVGVTVDPILTKIASTRAVQLLTEYDHNYKGQVADTVLAKQYGIYDTYFMTEDLTAVNKDNVNPAYDLIYGFQVDAHWYDLINPSASKIGIGMAEDPTNPGDYYVAVEMGF